MTRFTQALLAVFYLTTIIHADYIRFSIPEIQSIEPREWDVDHIWANTYLLTQDQNVTNVNKLFDDWPKGRHLVGLDLWKDITISANEPTLTLAFVIYNVGDGDPHKIGLEITSLVLRFARGIPGAGVITTLLRPIIDIFKDAYKCDGPVAMDVAQFSQKALRDMPFNRTYCTQAIEYKYTTGNGCRDLNPLTNKNSTYRVRYCYEKQRGESNAGGGTVLPSESVLLYPRYDFAGYIFFFGAMALFLGI